jgi:hypothetical protein
VNLTQIVIGLWLLVHLGANVRLPQPDVHPELWYALKEGRIPLVWINVDQFVSCFTKFGFSLRKGVGKWAMFL